MYKLTVIVVNEPYTAKIDLFSNLIPQYVKEIQLIKNTLKQTTFEDKTVKSTQLSLVLLGIHDFLIVPDRTAHA